MPSVFIKYQVHTVQVGGSQTELRSPALRIATHKPGYRAQGRDLMRYYPGTLSLDRLFGADAAAEHETQDSPL